MRLDVFFLIFIFGMVQARSNNTSVAIIGGGFAGLAAAAKLEKNGVEYILFEATDRLGGRVYPIQDKDNNTIQLGAEYINGDDNDIYRLAKKLDILDDKNSDYWLFQSNISYGIGGEQFSEEDLQTWKVFAEPLEEEFEQAGLKFPELSAEEYFNKKYKIFLQENGSNKTTFYALAKLYRSYYETEWSSPMDELALDNFQEWDDKSNDSTSWFLDGEGFKAILDELKKNITLSNVKFNSRVTNMNWTENYVAVALNGTEDAPIFDHVIVTVPLGFLKKNPNLFTPKLPKVKRDAIRYIGFGSLTKVFLEYEKRWWSPSVDVLMAVKLEENESKEKNITDYMRIFQVHEKNRLLLWLDGEGPKIAANLNDKELADIITHHLRVQFNNTDIPDPKAIYTHNWTADELTGGAYSYITPDSYENLNDSFLDMAEPIVKDESPLLCFAGEHTHQTMYQTTVGAYESGIREAKRLIKYMKKE